jgi:hypothetical protein
VRDDLRRDAPQQVVRAADGDRVEARAVGIADRRTVEDLDGRNVAGLPRVAVP